MRRPPAISTLLDGLVDGVVATVAESIPLTIVTDLVPTR
jgi:hypothetical protein